MLEHTHLVQDAPEGPNIRFIRIRLRATHLTTHTHVVGCKSKETGRFGIFMSYDIFRKTSHLYGCGSTQHTGQQRPARISIEGSGFSAFCKKKLLSSQSTPLHDGQYKDMNNFSQLLNIVIAPSSPNTAVIEIRKKRNPKTHWDSEYQRGL